tara:strand:- start:455 stop:865 length:411 start_codon:yes stop_codon:yes gene_type:complete
MKPQSKQGYLLSFAFINMYKKDGNEMNETLLDIQKELIAMAHSFIKQNSRKPKQQRESIEVSLSKAWRVFEDMTKEEQDIINVIPFVIRLIIRNPNSGKNQRLTKLAMKENRRYLFSKIVEVKKAKSLVDGFYGLR